MHCFVNFVISMSVTLGTSISSKVVTSFLVSWEKGFDLVQRTLEIVVPMITLKTSLILMSPKERRGIIGLHVISLLRTNTTKVILKGKFAFAFVFCSRFFLFRVIATCLIGSKMHFLTSFCKPVASESFCRKAIIKVKLVKLTNVCTISIF